MKINVKERIKTMPLVIMIFTIAALVLLISSPLMILSLFKSDSLGDIDVIFIILGFAIILISAIGFVLKKKNSRWFLLFGILLYFILGFITSNLTIEDLLSGLILLGILYWYFFRKKSAVEYFESTNEAMSYKKISSKEGGKLILNIICSVLGILPITIVLFVLIKNHPQWLLFSTFGFLTFITAIVLYFFGLLMVKNIWEKQKIDFKLNVNNIGSLVFQLAIVQFLLTISFYILMIIGYR